MVTLRERKPIYNSLLGLYNPKKNENIWLSINQIPIFKDNETKPFQIYSTFEDITEHKLAERRLKNSLAEAQRFRKALDLVPAYIYMKDIEFRYTYANRLTLDLFGCSHEDLIGKDDSCFFPPATVDHLKMIDARVLKGEQTNEEIDVDFNGTDRRVYWEVKTQLYSDDGKKSILGILGISTDITERKKIEEKLWESEEKYRLLFENSSEAIFLSDPDGAIYAANPEACRIFGYSEDEIYKLTRDSIVDLNDPRLPLALEERYRTGKFKGELNFVKNDGNIFPGEISSTIFIDSNGNKRTSMIIRDISKRILAQQALRQSEEKWRTLFELLPVGVSILDKNGEISEFNQSLKNILEITSEGIKNDGYKNRNYLRSDNSIMTLEEFPSLIAIKDQKIVQNIEIGVVKENKDIIWTEVSAAPLSFPDQICAIVTIDITERKKALKALIESEYKYRALLENALEGILILGLDGTIIFSNYAISRIFEVPDLSLIIGRKVFEFLSPEAIQKAEEDFINVLNGIDSYISQYRCFTVTGREIWVESIGKRILYEGNPSDIITLRDITERKKAEDLLRISEEKFSKIFELNTSIIIISTIEDGIVIDVNPEFFKLLGYTKDEVIGKSSKELGLYADYNERLKALDTFRETGSIKDIEIQITKKNGDLLDVFFSSQIIKINSIDHFLSVITDITKQKQIESQLKDAVASRDKFFSIIAHDLRSPFSGLMGISDIISKEIGTLSINEIKEMAAVLNNSTNSTFKLLNELLDWSGIQSGTFVYQPINCDLNMMIQETATLLKNRAVEKNISISLSLGENLNSYCDKYMISTVLRNLLSNAIKFTNKGGKVNISAISSEKVITIAVSDEGVGIPEEIAQNLFKIDHHISTLGTNNEKGSGLGLILCKDFVQKHGGRIWVESEIGIGSTFYFTINI
jgi:PAS domain S-box-containing protein